MRKLSFIRLISYAACAAAFVLATHQNRVIPVSLWGLKESDAQRDHEMALKSAAAIPKLPDFARTRMSGSQVLAAAGGGTKTEGFGEPQISLSKKDGRLVWTVSFYQIGGPPGAFFGVLVDDETGAAKLVPGM